MKQAIKISDEIEKKSYSMVFKADVGSCPPPFKILAKSPCIILFKKNFGINS